MGAYQGGTPVELSKIPKAAWVCLTIGFVVVLGAYVALSIAHVDTDDFYRFLNLMFNLASVVLGGGAVAFAGQAAKQTDGVLHDRIKEAVAETLDDRLPGAKPAAAVPNQWSKPPASEDVQ